MFYEVMDSQNMYCFISLTVKYQVNDIYVTRSPVSGRLYLYPCYILVDKFKNAASDS